MVISAEKAPGKPVNGNESVDARSQALTTISKQQADTMNERRELITVRIRVETSRGYHEALLAHAIQMETKKLVVPDDLKALIAQASEEQDVAFAIYQSRLKTASTEKAAAATARDALRELRATVTVNILSGKNAPEAHDLMLKPEEYDPHPPQEPERTAEIAGWKDPYCVARVTLDQQIAIWARMRDQAEHHKSRSELVPEAHQKALDKAVASLLAAETNICKLLATANTNVSAALAKGNIPATVKALRTVNWLQGLPPPTKADFPTGWKPTAVPTSTPSQRYANQYDLLPIDETEYEYESTSQQRDLRIQAVPTDEEDVEDSDRVEDPRAGKKHRGTAEVTNNDEADPSYVDGTVLYRAAEAQILTAEAKKDVIKAMEAQTETPAETTQDERNAHAEATTLARAAIATDADMLTKTQRSARDSNARFFTAIQPRLDGRADPMDCFKCEISDCILASKSRGDRAPAFQAQLQGKKCGKTVAPSVCMAYWYGAGTLHEYLPTQTKQTSDMNPTTPSPPGAEAANPASPPPLTAEQLAQIELAKRTNTTEAALISLEQAARDAAEMQTRIEARMAARDTTFQALVKAHQKRCVEDKKEADSAHEIISAIKTNIARAQEARKNGTAVTLVPIPAQLTSVPHPPLIARDAAPVRDPGTMTSLAFPPISTAGPQVPTKPFDRAAIRMSYSRALTTNPRSTPPQRRAIRQNRAVDEIAFILITNFDHQAISQTKKDFGEYLEIGTDILHYRRMPKQGLELALPKYQISTVSVQLRQMGYKLEAHYLPTKPMTRRRPEETATQSRERAAYCAHRAMSKVAEDPRANTAVADWFARACKSITAEYPHVFTVCGAEHWNAIMTKESSARRAAEATQAGENEPVTTQKQVHDFPTTPAPDANYKANADALHAAETSELSKARDNSVPGAK